MPANEFVHPVIWLITKNFSEFSKCEIIIRTSLKCNYNFEIEVLKYVCHVCQEKLSKEQCSKNKLVVFLALNSAYNKHVKIQLILFSALHPARGAEARAAPRPGRVLYPENAALLR